MSELMIMTQTDSILLSLITKSLFGTSTPIPSEADWSAVFSEAKQQTVLGIASAALPDDMPQEERTKWTTEEYRQIANQVRYWNAHDQLHQLLTDNNIPYVILKGGAAAMYYPAPMLRAMGDIDFLVPTEKFEQIRALLLSNGYQLEHDDDLEHEP